MKKTIQSIFAISSLLVGATSLVGCTAEIKITPTEEWEKQLISAIERGDTNFTLPDEIKVNPSVVFDQKTEEPSLPEIVEPELPEVKPKTITVTYLRVKTDSLNIRSGAGTTYSIIGQVNTGDHLPLVSESGNWYETKYLGKRAFVSKSYVTQISYEVEENEEVEKVLSVGYSLLGTPYLYGATRYHDGGGNLISTFTGKSFDCSSFTQYIYYVGAGKILATTTRGQVLQGTHVDTADLKRGDLLYMTNDSRINNVGIERIGHVAVYLGNNLMLHTVSDYAKIVSMTEKNWKYVIEIRRQGAPAGEFA